MIELASSIGPLVFTRLGVAAGMLATSATTSWWTAGASLVIGIALERVWNWIDDPKVEVTAQIEQKLGKFSLEVAYALKQELDRVAALRCAQWKKIVDEEVAP
jgi:hypothetical protein